MLFCLTDVPYTDCNNAGDLSDEVDDEVEFDSFGLKKTAALSLLKLSECHKLTQAAIKV